MASCTQCNAALPEGMRFCLQCGAPVAAMASPETPVRDASTPIDEDLARYSAPAPPVEVRRPQRPTPQSTIALKISPSPVLTPRTGPPVEFPRPSLGREPMEMDEEALRKAFERRVAHPGAVLCRFCKGPLDISGDFCEQCGAPVEEAAPPGTLPPKPPPAAVEDSPPLTAPAPAVETANPAAPAGSPVSSPPATPPATPTPAPAPSAAVVKPPPRTPVPSPVHAVPAPPGPPTIAQEPQQGLMGRLKGLFKKS